MGAVAVNLVEIGETAEEIAPIGTAMYGVVRAHRGVDLVRILVESRA